MKPAELTKVLIPLGTTPFRIVWHDNSMKNSNSHIAQFNCLLEPGKGIASGDEFLAEIACVTHIQ
jgi:hypothetical protein